MTKRKSGKFCGDFRDMARQPGLFRSDDTAEQTPKANLNSTMNIQPLLFIEDSPRTAESRSLSHWRRARLAAAFLFFNMFLCSVSAAIDFRVVRLAGPIRPPEISPH